MSCSSSSRVGIWNEPVPTGKRFGNTAAPVRGSNRSLAFSCFSSATVKSMA